MDSGGADIAGQYRARNRRPHRPLPLQRRSSDYAALQPPIGGDPADLCHRCRGRRAHRSQRAAWRICSACPILEAEGLVWLGARSTTGGCRELRLYSVTFATARLGAEVERLAVGPARQLEWEWRRALLGVSSSRADDQHFTLDDGTWRRVVSYRRPQANWCTGITRRPARPDRRRGDVALRRRRVRRDPLAHRVARHGLRGELPGRQRSQHQPRRGRHAGGVRHGIAGRDWSKAITNPLLTEGGSTPRRSTTSAAMPPTHSAR